MGRIPNLITGVASNFSGLREKTITADKFEKLGVIFNNARDGEMIQVFGPDEVPPSEGGCVLAVDPGNEKSAYLLFDGKRAVEYGILENNELLAGIATRNATRMAIEGVQCYGMPVGKETFDTCIWIGRFMERFSASNTDVIYRSEVKLHLCRSVRAKDPHIRQSLIDRFGPGKDRAIGKKATPGPLYGVSSHCWSALAVAVTWWDTKRTALRKDGHCSDDRPW